MCKDVNEMLIKKFIQLFKFPSKAPVFFVPKKNSDLRLCIDYQSLNEITIKNKHFLLLIQTFLHFLIKVSFFTKFDIISAYHALRIHTKDK